jgi:tRNA A37 methylthiotransferase MiaB
MTKTVRIDAETVAIYSEVSEAAAAAYRHAVREAVAEAKANQIARRVGAARRLQVAK